MKRSARVLLVTLALAAPACRTPSGKQPTLTTPVTNRAAQAQPAAPPAPVAAKAPDADPDPGPLNQFSLLAARVSGKVPIDWKSQDPGAGLKGRGDREALQFFIPYPETDNTADSANALLLAFDLPSDMTVKEFSDELLGDTMDPKKGGATTVKDVTEGAWRLIIARGEQQQTPYVLLHRFGVDKGAGVDLLVAVPLMEKGNQATVERIIAQFGVVGDSLSLNEAPAAKAR